MSRALFLLGSKRSGSSLLVRLLNLHPEVFVAHEADIAWILYQARAGWPGRFETYPWDGPHGMRRTLEAAGEELAASIGNGHRAAARGRTVGHLPEPPGDDALRTAFSLALARMRVVMGSPRRDTAPAWWGDKKPVQHGDPRLRPLLDRLFPEARYLHLVRHPRATVASMERSAAAGHPVPAYWGEGTRRVLERWVEHERWAVAVAAGRRAPGRSPAFHRLALDDLCRRPAAVMEEVFAFLELGLPGPIAEEIRRQVRPDPDSKYAHRPLPRVPGLAALLERYRYPERIES